MFRSESLQSATPDDRGRGQYRMELQNKQPKRHTLYQTVVGLVTLCLCFATNSNATEVLDSNFARGVQDAVGSTIRERAERTGIHLKKLTITPRVDAVVVYGNNLAFDTENTDYNTASVYSPGVEFDYSPSDRLDLKADYTFGWTDYHGSFAKDYPSHKANLSLMLDNMFANDISMGLSDSYTRTSTPGSNEVISLSEFQSNSLDFFIDKQWNRLVVTLRYGHSMLDYSDADQASANFQSHAGTLDFAYAISGKTAITWSVGSQLHNNELETSPDFLTHRASVGVKGQMGKLSYDFNIGYSTRAQHGTVEPDPALPIGAGLKVDDQADMSLTGSFSHKAFHDRLVNTFTVNRNFVPSSFGGTGTSTSAKLDSLFVIGRKISLQLANNIRIVETDAGDQKTWDMDFKVGYRVMDRFSISAGYSRFQNVGGPGRGSGDEIVSDSFTLGARFQW